MHRSERLRGRPKGLAACDFGRVSTGIPPWNYSKSVAASLALCDASCRNNKARPKHRLRRRLEAPRIESQRLRYCSVSSLLHRYRILGGSRYPRDMLTASLTNPSFSAVSMMIPSRLAIIKALPLSSVSWIPINGNHCHLSCLSLLTQVSPFLYGSVAREKLELLSRTGSKSELESWPSSRSRWS